MHIYLYIFIYLVSSCLALHFTVDISLCVENCSPCQQAWHLGVAILRILPAHVIKIIIIIIFGFDFAWKSTKPNNPRRVFIIYDNCADL